MTTNQIVNGDTGKPLEGFEDDVTRGKLDRDASIQETSKANNTPVY